MTLTIKKIKNKDKWENFVMRFSPNNFLQSWQFGQFNAAMGDSPLYLGVFDDERQVGAALFIKTLARRGNFLACAAGPLISEASIETTADMSMHEQVLRVLVGYLRKEIQDVVFIRIRSDFLDTDHNQQLYRQAGFRPAPMHLHAERTWSLDLAPDEDELLAQMRKKTRYSIKRATKDGVEVRLSREPEDVRILHRLQEETVARQKFSPFSLAYFEQLQQSFSVDDGCVVFLADYQGEDIAAAMINYYGDQAVYHYAASSSVAHKIPAAYAILWEAIREAKKRGCRYFNFWGVVGDEQTEHPWYGLSRFKKGFGGEEVSYLHAQDYALSWKYWITWIVETIRRRQRGL